MAVFQFSSPGLTDATTLEDSSDSSSSRFTPEQGESTMIGLQPSDSWLSAQCKPPSATLVKRRPIPRKGHTKSRRGCFSCKKRKIKCQETKPKCENCQKVGVLCEYPKPAVYSPVPSASPASHVQLQSTPTVFSIRDMQLFHHFLVRAYPTLPVGADTVWTMEIPKVAHEVRNSALMED